MIGAEIDRLVALLAKLPGLGPRSARRAALKLLQAPEERLIPLAAALTTAARAVRACGVCGNLDTSDPCAICSHPGRERDIICVVESVSDLWAMERAGIFGGVYHVLGGTLSALGGVGPEDLRTASLVNRAAGPEVREVILALGATVEGASTAHWLAERLRPTGVRVTQLGRGVPMGGALDSLDDGTLAAALRGRSPT
jgi:recombination protein RecR